MTASSASRLVLIDASFFDDDAAAIRAFLATAVGDELVASLQVVPMRTHHARALALFHSAHAAERAADCLVRLRGAESFLGFGVAFDRDEADDGDDGGAVADDAMHMLPLPPKQRQFLISPPPSPPPGWQPRAEEAPVPHPPPFLSAGETAVLLDKDGISIVLEQT